ncbi:hypothetical protein [Mycoplasma sp. Ms02]|uniref:hypothetical protein n=1 Tax=Mycoplasma sp. Ms02 TaxID=353851 RepID=UPI001C89435C|nr:hypothetical protein [Mycoplasma sp. Ms02]QZE12131.1 hypothetical protein K4L35_02155 [Mycoplasma sp. Ms02]
MKNTFYALSVVFAVVLLIWSYLVLNNINKTQAGLRIAFTNADLEIPKKIKTYLTKGMLNSFAIWLLFFVAYISAIPAIFLNYKIDPENQGYTFLAFGAFILICIMCWVFALFLLNSSINKSMNKRQIDNSEIEKMASRFENINFEEMYHKRYVYSFHTMPKMTDLKWYSFFRGVNSKNEKAVTKLVVRYLKAYSSIEAHSFEKGKLNTFSTFWYLVTLTNKKTPNNKLNEILKSR